MHIFDGIPPNGDYDSIRDAVVAIVRQAQAKGLQEAPWSLAELRPDNDDYLWLCDWTRNLKSGVAYRCLEEGQWRKFVVDELRFSYAVGIGTLLLMSAVEIARRESTLQSLWAAICQRQSESTNARLFVQGYPTQAYKDAIEQAARWLNLRHVFGIEGMQNWYDSISLQFGFSKQGFMRRLPEWLAGLGQTLSTQFLTGKMRSETFYALWDGLKQFRRKNWTETQLRTLLGKNPWVLPEWADDLVKQAQKKLDLGTDSGAMSSVQDEEGIDPFLSNAALRWDRAHSPRFVCSVINLAGIDLQESNYEIIIAGQVCGHLIKNSDENYSVFPSDTIEIPIFAPQVPASLIAPNGQVVQSLILKLWDGAEDVTAFHESNGQRFDAWTTRLRQERGIFLLLRDDLSLEPQASYWYVLNQQQAKLYYLEPGWSIQTKVMLEDQELWHPYLITPPMREETPAMASGIQVHIYEGGNPHFFGEAVQFIITLPVGVSLTFLRAGGQALAFNWFNSAHSAVLSEPLAITPSVFSTADVCKIEFLLGVKMGSTLTSLHRLVELPIGGAAVLSSQGWTALQPDDTLELEQIRMQPVKTFVKDIDRWALLEGDVWIGRLWKTPRPLVALSGLGAPLKLSEGVYNLVDEPRILAREIIDKGNLVSIELDAPDRVNRTLRVELSRRIEADTQDHAIYWWDQTGSFQKLVPENAESQGEAPWWLTHLPQSLTEPLAIAIAYKGIRLGTWWSADWNTYLSQSMQQSPQAIAALLRWLHLPLLSERYLDEVQSFAFTFAGETLAAWVGDNGLPDNLNFGESDDGWLSTVRAIFWNWQPTDVSVTQIISPLLADNPDLHPMDWLPIIAWKLLRVSPVLMGRIINQWINEVGIPQGGATNVKVLLNMLIYELAEAGSGQELSRKRAALEEHVANTMGVDSAFVERALIQRTSALFQGRSMTRLDQDNLAVAMNVEPFRRLLGIKLLGSIEQTITERRAG